MLFNQIATFFKLYIEKTAALKIIKNKFKPQVYPITAGVTLDSLVMPDFTISYENDQLFEIFNNFKLLGFYQVLGVYNYIILLVAKEAI